ncbi:hypothetical protein [Ewingella americana]|uniref:Uncharacterized protein n=1 Tax=Ewingella americana TaxID=41202 RepID=A0A502GEG8_9GAMM|nr:hypothetical protein [Ewingella americana]TPG60131.1 hypothetical protein EAH77_16310 [Ewingella americana]
MLNFYRKQDTYIRSIYQRLLGRVPDGNFYKPDVQEVPYIEGKTRFVLETSNVGLRHVISTGTTGYIKPLIAAAEVVDVDLDLEVGQQTITIQVFDGNGDTVDVLSVAIRVSNIATLLYSVSEISAPLWIELIDLYAKMTSGTRLLNFESTLSEDIREALPEDFSSKSLALKYLLRAKQTGMTSQAFESIVAVYCDMNFPKLSKFENPTEITGGRLETQQFVDDVTEVHVWTHSKAEAIRVARDILANNFPERYGKFRDTTEGIMVERADYAR